jgi:tetratricopeptide (TPR) repeat protein
MRRRARASARRTVTRGAKVEIEWTSLKGTCTIAKLMKPRALLAVAVLVGSFAATVPIWAGGAGVAAPVAKGGPAEFNDAINQGSLKYVGKETDQAIELFRKATQLQPRNPLGYYLLGEALLGAGSLTDAETAWLQGEQVADSGPPAVKAKLLFVLADLRERQGRWEDAKAAWKKYSDFASGNPDAGAFPESAATRIRDTEAMQKQYKDYAIVRKRIRDEDGGTLGKMPPPEKQ